MIIRMIILITTLYVSSVAASSVDYSEIERIKNKALKQASLFDNDAQQVVENSNKAASGYKLDKKEFLDMQKKLLSKAYKNKSEQSNTVVFVSFSMPKQAIKQLLRESEGNNASLVLNGLVNNSMKETLNKIGEFINEDSNSGGIQIDPNLFDEYKIKKVPAYVFINNDSHDVVYGASSIRQARDIANNSTTDNSGSKQ